MSWVPFDDALVPAWDAFAASTSAPTIHWVDVPGMARLSCPDGSHLDARDTRAFTEALVQELDGHGVLQVVEGRSP